MPLGTLHTKAIKALGAPVQMARRLRYDLDRGASDETVCRFVSCRGIAKSCHPLVHLKAKFKSRPELKLVGDLAPGAAIYLFTQCIPDFVANYLPRLTRPFRLVTGSDDHAVSPAAMEAEIDTLLNHPLLMQWYAQNAEISDPKLTLIPIGIDYHNIAGNHQRPWRRFQSPIEQENELLEVRAAATAVSERSCTAYANWHFHLRRGGRQECLDQVDHSAVSFEPEFVPRRRSWANNAKHLFTVSPPGNGLDCYRTWEALVLGTIPIVRTSSLDALYAGLPVCIVQDWSQVTRRYLEEQRERLLEQEFAFEKVSMKYWAQLVQGHAIASRPMSIQAFLDA